MAERVLIVGLIQVDLRSGATLRLTDGGFVEFGGETFTSEDPVYGSIASVSDLREGTGNEVPALQLTLSPSNSASIPTLAQPVNSKSQVRMWTAEVDPQTGTIIGTPKLHVRAQIERMPVRFGRNVRRIDIEAACRGVKLLDRYEGNSASAAFRRRVWPGETGSDGRLELGAQVAWGAPSPPGGTVTSGVGGGGFASGIVNAAVRAA